MANVVAGRASRPTSAERIEHDLAELWRDVAHDEPISRAVMSNLVIFCRCSADTREDLVFPHAHLEIEQIVQRHPARVIVLGHDAVTGAECGRMPPVLRATVDVLTFGAPGSRYGVEQLAIRSACGDAAIRSIVRRLTLGDVPTTVWWTDDLSKTGPLAAMVRMGRQFLYDSRCWVDVRAATLALAPLLVEDFRPDLADRNWRRLAAVRRAIRHALESRGAAHFGTARLLRVRHRHGESALAWLLVAWAHVVAGPDRAQMTRPKTGHVRLEPPIEDAQLDGDVLVASFDGGFNLRMTDNHVIVEDPAAHSPFTLPSAREHDAEAIAAELGMLTRDTVFHNVLGALVEHFERA